MDAFQRASAGRQASERLEGKLPSQGGPSRLTSNATRCFSSGRGFRKPSPSARRHDALAHSDQCRVPTWSELSSEYGLKCRYARNKNAPYLLTGSQRTPDKVPDYIIPNARFVSADLKIQIH